TVLESSYRKFGFLNMACARTQLRGLHALLGRAPQALGGRIFDAVLVRAVAQPEEAVRLGMRSVRRDGGLCLLFLRAPPGDNPTIRKALRSLSASVSEDVQYLLPREPQHGHLAVLGVES